MRLSKDRFYRGDYRIDRGRGAEVFPLYTYGSVRYYDNRRGEILSDKHGAVVEHD